MSIWRAREWQDFAKAYQIKMLNFGSHQAQVRGPPSGVLPDGHNPDRNGMTLQERCDDSKSWAAWAPGLKVALVLAIQDRLHRGATPSLEAALRPLGQVALDSWRAHYLNDHMPAHRDCKLTVLRPIP